MKSLAPSEAEIQQVRETARRLLKAPDLELHVHFDIHSGVSNHRALLRNRLKTAIQEAFPSAGEISKILIPGTRGPLGGVFFSLSHCPLASGFALASTRVGFDVESASRVHTGLNMRIRNTKDVPAALASLCFWSAKESAFKAFSMEESSTLSQIAITSWDETPEGHFLFEASTESAGGKGIAANIQTTTVSIFRKQPSFSR